MSRRTGIGSLYRRARSPYWWMRYYVRGERVYESTETSSRRAAERILRKRLGAADAAATPPSL